MCYLIVICRVKWGSITGVVVMDSEICGVVDMVSEAFSIRFVDIDQPLFRFLDLFDRCTCVEFIVHARNIILTKLVLVSLSTRFAVIIGDVLVLLVTWSKTARSYRESRRTGIRAPLATLLFRDGERDFGVCALSHKLISIFRDVLFRVNPFLLSTF